jgi:NitT/TauT family transport system substrate-binding protein
VVAARLGFFAEAGFAVMIEPIQAGVHPYQQLAGGGAQFAIVDSVDAFLRYAAAVIPAEDGDDSFQILAAIHQETTIGLVALAGTGIATPQDLRGRTVGLPAGSLAERLWPAYAELTGGLDWSTVETVSTDPSTQVRELLAGALHAIGVTAAAVPGIQAAIGDRELPMLPYAHAMPDLYGDALVAPKRLLHDHPDLARRFTGALLRGLVHALDNPQEAEQVLREAGVPYPQTASAELELMRGYVYGGLIPGEQVGFIEEVRAVRGMALLTAAGLVSGDANHALGSTSAGGSDGVVNYRFVPGAGGT